VGHVEEVRRDGEKPVRPKAVEDTSQESEASEKTQKATLNLAIIKRSSTPQDSETTSAYTRSVGSVDSSTSAKSQPPKQQAADRQPLVKVSFRWEYKEEEQGEEVWVVGSCAELGNWNLSGGHRLVQKRDTCFWASGSTLELPLCRRLEYRYVVSCEGQEVYRDHAPRALKPTGRRHVVEDDGGALRALRQTCPLDDDFISPRSPSQSQTRLDEEVKAFEHKVEITSDDVVYFVCTQLPVSLQRNSEGEWVTTKTQFKNSVTLPLIYHFAGHDETESYGVRMVFVGALEFDPRPSQSGSRSSKRSHSTIAFQSFPAKRLRCSTRASAKNFCGQCFTTQRSSNPRMALALMRSGGRVTRH
jgi:hypothetical protein